VNLDLPDEQKATERLARDFAQNEVKRVAEELEKEKRFPYEIVVKLGELGLMGVPYPEEYGGRRADTLVIEELARFPMKGGVCVEGPVAPAPDEQHVAQVTPAWRPQACALR
jgi:alkylation response protein AidB-like acyl-CoA dehydrogenase